MGLDFQAPPRQNKRQWRKVEMLARAGITFHSCGCGGPGYRPKELRETPAFVERVQRGRESYGQSLRRRFEHAASAQR